MEYNKENIISDFNKGKKLEFIYFWSHNSKSKDINKSCLSQWFPCEFEIEGITYNSTEQWMMSEKARFFNDSEILEKILQTDSPTKIKEFGRQVKNFDSTLWKTKSIEVVKKGNIHKFQSNKDLKIYLLSTKNKILVEASPYDLIWGIGLSEQEKQVNNPNNWKGLNLLGFILMEVRDYLYL